MVSNDFRYASGLLAIGSTDFWWIVCAMASTLSKNSWFWITLADKRLRWSHIQSCYEYCLASHSITNIIFDESLISYWIESNDKKLVQFFLWWETITMLLNMMSVEPKLHNSMQSLNHWYCYEPRVNTIRNWSTFRALFYDSLRKSEILCLTLTLYSPLIHKMSKSRFCLDFWPKKS